MSQLALRLTLVIVSLCALPARAQDRFFASPMGGRSALMGNTGVALGNDGAAPFLNPAAIAHINDTQFAFSANIYSYASYTAPNWYAPGAIDESITGAFQLSRETLTAQLFDVIPSTVCYFYVPQDYDDPLSEEEGWNPLKALRMGQRVALCLGTSQRSNFSFIGKNNRDESVSGIFTRQNSLRLSFERFEFGPVYSRALTRDVAIGISVMGSSTDFDRVLDASSTFLNREGAAVSSFTSAATRAYSVDVTGTVGVTWKFSQHYVVGASFRFPSIHLYDEYETYFRRASYGTTIQSDEAAGRGTFTARQPMRIALGLGGEHRRFRFEFDLYYHFAMDRMYEGRAIANRLVVENAAVVAERPINIEVNQPSRHVVDFGAGAEYFFTDRFSVMGGVNSSFSAFERLKGAATPNGLDQWAMNQLNFALGVGNYGRGGELLIGVQGSYMWGQIAAVNSFSLPNDLVYTDLSGFRLMAVIAGRFNLRALQETFVNAGKAWGATEEDDER